MSKVIEIKKHIALEQQRKKEEEQLNLAKPLLHFLQCSSCMMKCCRCGSSVDTSLDHSSPPNSASFAFCSDCKAEYMEYQRLKLNKERTDKRPWHNQQWEAMWDSWIAYQKNLRKFLSSKEVRGLIKDFKK
jgi:hypothetical protein